MIKSLFKIQKNWQTFFIATNKQTNRGSKQIQIKSSLGLNNSPDIKIFIKSKLLEDEMKLHCDFIVSRHRRCSP
jgi:hypothetical protein